MINVEPAEKLVISVVKYICRSFNLVPPQIRQALSIFRAYISTKTNVKELIYKSISETFMKGFICEVFSEIKKYVPTVKNVDLFDAFSKLLDQIFSHAVISGDFEELSGLQNRLDKHTYELLFEFALTVSECDGEAEFNIPKPEVLARSIEEIAKTVSASFDVFAPVYKKIASNGGSILGFNYSTVLVNYFVRSSDLAQPAKENDVIEEKVDDVNDEVKEEEEDKKEEE